MKWEKCAEVLDVERDVLSEVSGLTRAARVASLSSCGQRRAWRSIVAKMAVPRSADMCVEREILGGLGESYEGMCEAVDNFGLAAPAALRWRRRKSDDLEGKVASLEKDLEASARVLEEVTTTLALKRKERALKQDEVDALIRERMAALLAPWKATVLALFVKKRLKYRFARTVFAKKKAAFNLQSLYRRALAKKIVTASRVAADASSRLRRTAAAKIQARYRLRLYHAKLQAAKLLAEQRARAKASLESWEARRRDKRALARARDASLLTNDALAHLATHAQKTLDTIENHFAEEKGGGNHSSSSSKNNDEKGLLLSDDR